MSDKDPQPEIPEEDLTKKVLSSESVFESLFPNKEMAERKIVSCVFSRITKKIKSQELNVPEIKSKAQVFDSLADDNQERYMVEVNPISKAPFLFLNCFLRQQDQPIALSLLRLKLFQQSIEHYLAYVSPNAGRASVVQVEESESQIAQTISDILVLIDTRII